MLLLLLLVLELATTSKQETLMSESSILDLVRHFYRMEEGRRVMNTFGKVAYDPTSLVGLRQKMEKIATADPDLLKVALQLAGDRDVLDVYEQLGGTFSKEALGSPMFQPPSLPQSPATPASPAGQAVKPPQQPSLKPPTAQPGQPGQPGQATQPQPQAGQQSADQQIKVQLQSPAPGQQGTTVSVG